MSLVLTRSDDFWADMLRQIDWIAECYVDAVEFTLGALIKAPGMGRPRFVDWPELTGIRSWKVQSPYQRHWIFYRFDHKRLFAERILHGSRDLPRVLLRQPED